MRIFLTLCFFILLAFQSPAQLVTVKFGEEEKETDGKKYNFFPYFIGKDGDEIYMLRLRKIADINSMMFREANAADVYLSFYGLKKFRNDEMLYRIDSYVSTKSKIYLEKYNKNLNLISKTEINYKDDKITIRTPVLSNGRVIFFATQYDKASKLTSAGYAGVSEHGLLHGFKVIDKNESKSSITFDFYSSNNGKYHLIFNEYTKGKKGSNNSNIRVSILNSKMEVIEQKDIDLKVDAKKVEIEDIKISNDGTVAFSTKIYPEKDDKDDGLQKYSYNIFVSKIGTTDPVKIPVNFGLDRLINDLNFFFNTNERLIISGFFSEKKQSTMKGVFFQDYDFVARQFKNEMLKEFKLEHIGLITGKAKNKEVPYYHIRNIYANSNGTYTMVAENFFFGMQNTKVYSPGNKLWWGTSGQVYYSNYKPSLEYYYNYENILAVNFDKSGNINWLNVIEKDQESTNDGAIYSSFSSIPDRDNLYIFYNGHRKNPDKRTANMRKTVAYVSKIDIEGNMSTDPVFSSKDEDIIMTPRINMVDHNNLYIHNLKGKHFKISEIGFKY